MNEGVQALHVWWVLVGERSPWFAAALALPLLLAGAAKRWPDKVPRPGPKSTAAVLIASFGVGYLRVWQQRSLFDDAFISFRFSRNFADGHGLVWNVGERVEGYTNFLWTGGLGLFGKVLPWEIHWIGFVASMGVFGACLAVTWRLGRALQPEGTPHLPIAVALLGTHQVFTEYGTTGMETEFAALLVLAGALFLVREPSPASLALAGTFLIGAALTRMDHGLFYAAGSAVVGADLVRRVRVGDRADVVRLGLAWSAPFLGFVAWLGWKLSFYGELLPNTYYAKAAHIALWREGLLYGGTFLLSSGGWLVVPAALAVGVIGDPPAPLRRFRWFVALGGAMYITYVTKVGGDYMVGRFYVTLIPLAFLAAEAVVLQTASKRRWMAAAVAALLLASCVPTELWHGRQVRWGMVREGGVYPIMSFDPFRVAHESWSVGRRLGRLREAGVEPILGTGGIGMVGYYSGLELVDSRGLTDKVVGRSEKMAGDRRGHTRIATREYIRGRGVHLLRLKGGQKHFHPKRYRKLTRIRLAKHDKWQIAVYDPAIMAAIREADPKAKFTDFQVWLDVYNTKVATRNPKKVRRDLKWFRTYYFDHNDDPARLAPIEARAAVR
ncbi:MAG: hypothetical protein GY898_28110 [Proteobacteria bacterium]|nr:hypothetical protein [Pseudomonadota bacterium]